MPNEEQREESRVAFRKFLSVCLISFLKEETPMQRAKNVKIDSYYMSRTSDGWKTERSRIRDHCMCAHSVSSLSNVTFYLGLMVE